MRFIQASYEGGLLRPKEPLALRPGERVRLIVVREPDPKRWNIHRHAASSGDEDRSLAEQGLGDWAASLDREDRT